MKSSDLIRELEAAGWYLDRIHGSHHVFRHPRLPGAIPVPHPRKDLPKGTLHAIRKRAGLIH
jgi:predicted RNA binding protein YcfA (HicA-like mRNA interferase family)